MNRRGLLQSILAAAVAPAIVRADSLMRIIPAETVILRPVLDIDIWAGAIREISACDIVTDSIIRRFDVIVRGVDGSEHQVGVDLRESDYSPITAPDIQIALSLLKSRAGAVGVPIKGALPLKPNGFMDGHYL